MFERALYERYSFFGGLQYGSDTDIIEREWMFNVIIGAAAEISPVIGVYAELYNGIHSSLHSEYVVNQNGFTFAVHPKVQLDVYGGWKVTGNQPAFWGFGLSVMR
jgi:hypothetical protein